MPSTSLKNLYFAKSVQELETRSTLSIDIKNRSTTSLANSAGAVFKEAERYHTEHDEEKAYIQYMRFVELVLTIQKKPDFKRENFKQILEWANIAISKAESLKESLKERYSVLNEVSTKEIKKNVIVAEIPKSQPDVIKKIPVVLNDTIKEKKHITSSELHALLNDRQQSLIIMDVRPSEDFLESHIKHSCCINIPQEILCPGLTAAKLESLLPKESLSLWYKRSKVDCIILMDFSSKNETIENSHLNILKTAMSKWDRECLKTPPVILKGGYKDWMSKYPMYTTQVINFDSQNDILSSPVLADLSEIDYPNLDDNDSIERLNEKNSNEMLFKKTTSSVTTPNGFSVASSVENKKSYSAPAIDRRSKPFLNLPSKPPKNLNKSNSNDSFSKKNSSVVDKVLPSVDRKLKNLVLRPTSDKNSKYISDSSDEELSVDKENQGFKNNKLKHSQELKRNSLHNNLKGGENNKQDEIFNRLKQTESYIDEKDVTVVKKPEKVKFKEVEEESSDDNRKGNEPQDNSSLKKHPSLHEKIQEDQRKDKATMELPGSSKNKMGLNKYNYSDNKSTDATTPLENFVPLSRQSSSDSSSIGLVRSHSSPNIAQMLNEEENKQVKIPAIDRSLKPKVTNTMQLNEINIARQRNLNPVYGNCPVRPATGLKNLGNTCFMNSVIQCLSNTIPLANYIISGQYIEHINRNSKQSSGGEIVEEFAAVIKALWMGHFKSIYPKDFKNTVSRCLSVCIGNEQQDSHEFLVVLMEKLHADLNKKQVKTIPKLEANCSETSFWQHHKMCNNSKISDIFDGMLKSTLTCLSCGKTSNSFEVSSCLSLPILTSKCTLKDCFKHFLKPEKISGEAAWDCPRCKQKKEAEKRLSICRLPEVLVIQLKRFSYEGLWRRKLQTHVDFDLIFNVPFEENSYEYSRSYSLYGIVNHYGTLEGGHYTAYCKTNSGKWFKYDDHEVSEINSSDIKTSAAYLLFYITSDFQSRL